MTECVRSQEGKIYNGVRIAFLYDGDDSKEQDDLVKHWYASLDKARDEWEAKRGVTARGG